MLPFKLILIFTLPFTFTFTFTFGTALASAGGYSGSGGGGGVICFDSSQKAVEADKWIGANQTLPLFMLINQKVQVLESFEMQQQGMHVWKAKPQEPWQSHLQNVENVLRADFPLFMYRLDQVGDWSQLLAWQESEEVGFLDDAKPVVVIPQNCRRVQIALRFSSGNNKLGEGPTQNRPVAKVVYNKRYFEALSTEDQAMLVFHEKLYMLRQALGASSSDLIRGFVRIFFDESAAKMQGQPGQIIGNEALFMIKSALVRVFGDYTVYFSNTVTTAAGVPFSSSHHFAAFFKMQLRLRERMGVCMVSLSSDVCLQKVMNPLVLENELNPEEAFVYFAFFSLEKTLHRINADQVMDPLARDPQNFRQAMQITCSEVVAWEPKMKVQKLMANAKAYCQQWGNHSALFSQGNKSN